MFSSATFLFLSGVIMPFWKQDGGASNATTILYKLPSDFLSLFSVSLFQQRANNFSVSLIFFGSIW